tara:strand:- start:50490 stop:50912 length:423 start_codon:yes stop_codon:yes gene_type:complete
MEASCLEYFKLPFTLDSYTKTKVWANNGDDMLFDFADEIYAQNKPYTRIDDESKENIVNCLNGTYTIRHPHEYKREGTGIYVKLGSHWLLFIVLRGWGHLVGKGGGLGFSIEKASKIQDELGDWIMQKLNPKGIINIEVR